MTIYNWPTKKGKRYYFQFMVNGRYVRSQGGFDSYKEAQTAEILARNQKVHPEKILFQELFLKYLEYIKGKGQTSQWIEEKRRFIERNCKIWFTSPISKIRRIDIEDELLKKTNHKANKFLVIVKALFTYAEKMELIMKNPCHGIEMRSIDEPKRYVVPIEDLKKVIEISDEPMKEFLMMLFLTGGRFNELLSLRWDDVSNEYVMLYSRKHTRGDRIGRRVPLTEMSKTILNEIIKKGRNNSDYVFFNDLTMNRYYNIQKKLGILCIRSNVKIFGYHSIRRLSASIMSYNNTSLRDIQSILGHNNITTTSIYLSSNNAGLCNAVSHLQRELE
jgi:integrase